MRPAPTIRLRLTLWYGGLFLLAGSVLLALNFALVRQNFPSNQDDLLRAVAERLDVPIEEFRAPRVIPVQPRRPGGRVALAFSDLFGSVGEEIKADTLEQLALQSGVALAVMAVVSMGLGWTVAGRMLRPLHDISSTVRRISEQSLDERVALEGPSDELRELADQFDVMLDRLQAAFEAQRHFVANASHELRTPLTIMRTEIDVTLEDAEASSEELRAMAEVVRRAIDRAERLIDGLLLLATADAPVERVDGVDLGDLVQRSLEQQAPALEERGLRPRLALSPAPVMGNRALLERLVGNLVENAVLYNVEGGALSVATDSSGGVAVLRVANDGRPIPESEVEGLFERFARLDRSRSRATGGYGLGLAIVRTIAHGHGGTATAHARLAGGLEVEVRLPDATSAAG